MYITEQIVGKWREAKILVTMGKQLKRVAHKENIEHATKIGF